LGYHGRDVDTIARDLVEVSINLLRTQITELFNTILKESLSEEELMKDEATKLIQSYLQQMIENSLLHLVLGTQNLSKMREGSIRDYLNMLRNGELDDKVVEISVPDKSNDSDISALRKFGSILDSFKGNVPENRHMPDLGEISNHQTHFDSILPMMRPSKVFKKIKLTVKEAKVKLAEMELDNFLSSPHFIAEAKKIAENDGIVFIDEIDKICGGSGKSMGYSDPSGEGVQKDLLPLLEGCEIATIFGAVKTDHVLFITSGAFHQKKPSDLMSELQGRLPVRVILNSLNTPEELYQVLTVPTFNLIRQHTLLLNTEGIKLTITDEAIKEIASFSALTNSNSDNLGARRLLGVLEKVTEELSFMVPDLVKAKTDEAQSMLTKIGLSQFEIIHDGSKQILHITITDQDVKHKLEKTPDFTRRDVKKFII